MRKRLIRGLRDPFFPVTYLMHNMAMLEGEAAWSRLPLRVRKALFRKILRERYVFFQEVRKWVIQEGRAGVLPPAPELTEMEGNVPDASSYCDHCGGCCQIASGFPDFPPDSRISPGWKKIFGDGLGRGHRFCPFLWEVHGKGISFCSIHSYRSNPCRAFEREECDYFKADADFLSLCERVRRRSPCRWLVHLLIDGR